MNKISKNFCNGDMNMRTNGDILEGLQERRQFNTGMTVDEVGLNSEPKIVSPERTSIYKFLKDIYGDKRRKGIIKPAKQHPFDVADNIDYDSVDSQKRRVALYRKALLHDAIEDSQMSFDELKELLGLDDGVVASIKRLTRQKVISSDEYIGGIFEDEDAVIVKLADRIANSRDLILWMENVGGVNTAIIRIVDKYTKENEIIFKLLEKSHKNFFKSRTNIGSTLWSMAMWLKQLVKELNRTYNKYKAINVDTLSEATFTDVDRDKHGLPTKFDIQPEDIEPEDIERVRTTVLRIYDRSEELQKAYPDYPQRFKKLFSDLRIKIENKGFPYVKSLFDKVAFDEASFVKQYEDYLTKKILESLKKLQGMKDDIPTGKLMFRIEKGTKKDVGDIYDMAISKKPEDIKWLFKEITKVMDKVFVQVVKDLRAYARDNNGKVIFRPGRYKNADRAYAKYMQDMGYAADEGGKSNKSISDFFEIGDIMGFRGIFHQVDDLIEFALSVLDDDKYCAYKLESYVGTDSAYQGINMNINYDGAVNFECQSVIDNVQVATDLNNDIFYNELMKVNENEKQVIAMMVQICLGYMFDELFKFKK